ncbi:MAG: glycosyltransferase family 4 protein [Caldilineaceae bacterium]
MRVGLVIYGTLDTVSGGYLYDRQLVAFLRGQGHTVEIISLPWRSYPAHLADNNDPALLRRLAGLDVDVLLQDELNHPSLAYLNPRLRDRGRRYPMVSIVHHLRSEEEHPAAVMPVYRSVETSYVNSVDGFIFNSETTRGTVTRLLDAPKPGIVVYPAADHIAPPDAATVQRLIAARGRDEGPLRLIAVGNLIDRKGIHDVIAALATLPRGAFTLDVIGNGDVDPAYTAALRAAITEHNLSDAVTLHGALAHGEIGRRLAAADLFVLPSYEGFGIVYLEAMAHGLPVIAATAGAAHEIVTPGVDGYLVAPGAVDDLAALLAHVRALSPAARRDLATAARARYDRQPTWQMSMARASAWLHEFIATWNPGASAP